jgi:hypothetical protein
MLDLPIEQRYRKENRMFHTYGFAAAAVISVAGSAISTGMQVSAANKAAAAQGRAAKQAQKREDQAISRFREAMGQVQAPQWNIGRDIGDAAQITEYNYAEVQKRFPESKQTMANISKAVEAQTRGEIPEDLQRLIRQTVAQNVGGSFAPTTTQAPIGTPIGGFQVAEGLSATTLGRTSMDIQQQGMQNFWQQMAMAGAFTESPLQVSQARLGYEEAAAEIQMQKAAAEAGMVMQSSGRQYGRAVDTIGSRLAAANALSTGINEGAQSLAGVAGMYGQSKAAAQYARGASGMNQGFSFFGEMAPSEKYSQGMRGYGLAGSMQNLYMGQLGKRGTSSMMPSGIRALSGAYGPT